MPLFFVSRMWGWKWGEDGVEIRQPRGSPWVVLCSARVMLCGEELLDACFDVVHEPHGCGGGSTDAYALFASEPLGAELVFAGDEVRIGVGVETFGKEDLTVATLLATHEDDEFVGCSKFAYLVDAIGYLTADGVVALEGVSACVECIDFLYDLLESLQGLGGLGIEIYVAIEVDVVDVVVDRKSVV